LVPAPDGSDNLIGIGLPDEPPGFLIMILDEAIDGGLEIKDGAEAPPFFMRQWVSLAKKPSTAFNQEDDVDTKWNVQCRCR